jgi:ATP-binding protein involved in chromosome partitioning
MSYFLCPKCGERSEIFGHGGAEHEAETLGLPFLGAVPLEIEIRTTSDDGRPIVATRPESPHAEIYRTIAARVWAGVGSAGGKPAAPPDLTIADAGAALVVRFADGTTHTLPAEMLRVMSPSAEVQGHSPSQRVTVGNKRSVRLKELRPVGNYAVRIVFDDGHDSGLFAWSYLATLGQERETRWATYLAELSAKGLTRG